MYVPDMEDNVFWINLYLKESENVLYEAFDLFAVAIRYQSIPIESQNQIASFTIGKIGEFVQTQEGSIVNNFQNAIYLLNVFVQVTQNPIVMEFLNENIRVLFGFVQNMIQNPLSKDNREMTCLLENVASLYLNYACYAPAMDPQVLIESINIYPPLDITEHGNFLSAFVKLMNNESSPYASQLFQPIYVALLKFFSLPTSEQTDIKIESNIKRSALSLLYSMTTKIEHPETFVQEFFKNEPLKLYRITQLLNYLGSK